MSGLLPFIAYLSGRREAVHKLDIEGGFWMWVVGGGRSAVNKACHWVACA